MGSTVGLGTVSIRCPRCRTARLEYDNAKELDLDTTINCPRCRRSFRAEDGVDMREVEDQAVAYVEKQLKKAFKDF